ncbi:MAG: AraC family transcriptional regulator [Lentisphaeria bacterium]|jgi:AraC-like DNA-binding protein/quercetin dioxygenase-like cupin family protein
MPGLPETHNIGPLTQEWLVAPGVCPAMAALRMRHAGFSLAAEGYCWIRHHPHFSQVIVCHEGGGEVFLNDSWQRWEAGQALLTPANVPHAYRAAGKAPWGIAWVIYDSPIVSSSSVTLLPADPWPLRYTIEGLYRQTRHAPESAAARQWLELVHGYASQLAGPRPHQGRLTDVWAAVEAQLARPWTLADLARQAHFCGEYLRRLSLEEHGRSPMRQVAYLRIQRAASLLSRTDDKIEAIARAVGFATLPAFSAAFKHWMGVSPAAFRRQQPR